MLTRPSELIVPIQTKKQRAVTLFQQRQIGEAMQLFEQICNQSKKDFEARIYLGITKSMLGDSVGAEKCLQHAVKLQPSNSLAHFNLACALQANGKYDESAMEYQRATKIKPNYFEAWHNLGGVLRLLGQTTAASSAFSQALKLNPACGESYRDLASTYLTQGNVKKATEACRQVLAVNPGHTAAHSLLLFLSTLYLYDPRVIFQLHRAWQEKHSIAKLVGWWKYKNKDADELIRVGYMSPNFYRHSVASFFEPLIENHDRSRFQIYCYSDTKKQDAVTKRIKSHASAWRDTARLSDDELAKQINDDRIHILVDLAGHTTKNRLMVMLRKPAPIQIQYIGYLFSTGIDTIDYWMTDRWTDPPGLSDEVSAETIIRLPHGYLCYRPNEEAPDVAQAPWELNGYVTFGSFNHISKVSDETFELWTNVLLANPDSRLVLKNESFMDEPTKLEWIERFESKGITRARIDLLPITQTVVEHLKMYSQIDVGLDTLPYNGTTTTCEALWQGVPVITLPGDTHCGRQGISLLSQVGLHNLVASSQSEYIDIATQLATKPKRISELKINT